MSWQLSRVHFIVFLPFLTCLPKGRRARQGQPHRRQRVKTVKKKEKQKQNTGQKAIAGRKSQTPADEP
jgi:hypothetical protein